MFAFDKPVVWVIILLIVIVLFGAGRLTDIGKSLGRGIREFKEETQAANKDAKPESTTTVASSAVTPADNEEVVITRRERKREDGTTEVIEDRVIRKKAQL
ncbi:twin-arginine translocase TatA/TatE family subunit [Candidatus Chlorohelix sp.]|uniref:twin-arginine translocase TatA/TatE family subunit n=1 Tax=Candidatus Chlorohelix sp. TaxID=3139201 RepID=UPI003035D950